MNDETLGASFRDPSGFVFERDGALYRQVNDVYASDYQLLMASGLYEALTERRLLVSHRELEIPAAEPESAHRVLAPERVPFVSYPYEWCFSQLKDAALLTLEVQRQAIDLGMTLKDASAYNVQFHEGRPIFIDTLSFERYQEGRPWQAYRQFCEHFLAPLALVATRDVRLSSLLRTHLDGIPLDLTAEMLPARSWWRLSLLLHVRLHARFQKRFDAHDGRPLPEPKRLSRQAMLNLVSGLEGAVRQLRWTPQDSPWSRYYQGDSYDAAGFDAKREILSRHLASLQPKVVWDLGANTGLLSRLASERGARTLAFDVDPACVEACYRDVREKRETKLLPLVLDLTNPSPALGWGCAERDSLLDRSDAELVVALALIHHLAIGHNVPIPRIATFLARLAGALVIEFVPKSDPKVQTLLRSRRDVFDRYTEADFEKAFERCYAIDARDAIADTGRVLYRMRRRADWPAGARAEPSAGGGL